MGGALGYYSLVQDAISVVGNDREMELFGTYAPLQDAISGVGDDAEWGSLGRYSPLHDFEDPG